MHEIFLTAGCAVCHDHKFDPLAQREFYSLAAFFNNTTQAGLDGNIKDTPPILVVPRMQDRDRWMALTADLVEAKQQLDERKTAAKGDYERWLSEAKIEQVRAALR